MWSHGSTGDCGELPFRSWSARAFTVPVVFLACFFACLWLLFLAIVQRLLTSELLFVDTMLCCKLFCAMRLGLWQTRPSARQHSDPSGRHLGARFLRSP